MSMTLGEKLRQAREERGITISEVAEQTRISSHYLDSIENDDYRTLPGGIFNKGFVKSYAKYVGLDEQEALQDYTRLIAEQEGHAEEDPKLYRPEVLTDDRNRSSMIPTIIFAVIILGLMTWGLLALVRYIQENQNQPPANSNTSTNSNSAANANSNVNAAQNNAPINEIAVEFKALSRTINVTYWTDGSKENKSINVEPAEPLSIKGRESVKISYYGGFTPDKIQLTVNGKQIPAPEPPTKGNILFEINKENIRQILENGKIEDRETNTPAANTNTAKRR